MMRYPERERRRIALLRGQYPELREPLAFLDKVAEIAARFVPEDLDITDVPQLPAGSTPLAPERFPLDVPAAVVAFHSFLEALVESTASESAREALTALDEGRLDPHRLIRAYCAGEVETMAGAAQEDGLDEDLLWHLAELAVKPQLVAAARALAAQVERIQDRRDRCPLCGSFPDLGLVTDARGARRVMLAVCRLCESQWPVDRVRCLFCGNEDDETLSYVQVDGEQEARVYVCALCHRYLPVLDVSGGLQFAPAVERVALAHLEVLAVHRGCRPLASGDGVMGSTHDT